ncbi:MULTISPECIES: FAS1-like dehydratase domain-containing protein [Pseudomonas]|uniref:FAS1-like dehydratase domain-containing protein n=1 Tax=Pseudomonas TaxID=286 RepID=UPI001F2F3BD0|nr:MULTISPECIES: MaoC family dehydratase N-terminal domain-containing protein [Pseudomonas]MCF5509653.1 protein dehydratase [Pseudomonas sp. PA-3-6H]MCF5517514.1 protein dehydratase [Pseudomonas sp. PA-3-6E]MCF5564839.1 protein dehydratase [Pseudomonas sp. PA-3-5D]MCF5567898.1 protein dehydratase [Pseudomonas sp. PA-3-11C]MCF5597396.1 protein dehydratase [Pseudomonas sp. PA-3-10C]
MTESDLEPLKAWLGRRETSEAVITPGMLEAYRATLAPYLWEEDSFAPPGLHWCLAPVTAQAKMAELDVDGHPQRGGFLPPVPLPRRMWAGGEVETFAPLPIGECIERVSTVTDIRFKEGRSGNLCFVTVEHVLSCAGVVAIRERQDIVYRGAATGSPAIATGETRTGELECQIDTPPSLLFRYSALTFNAHRIHYDLPYATGEEGYAGLVVHGPLQASLLFNLSARLAGQVPRRFAYRGQAPLIAGAAFRAAASWTLSGESLSAWTQDRHGAVNMQAEATC